MRQELLAPCLAMWAFIMGPSNRTSATERVRRQPSAAMPGTRPETRRIATDLEYKQALEQLQLPYPPRTDLPQITSPNHSRQPLPPLFKWRLPILCSSAIIQQSIATQRLNLPWVFFFLLHVVLILAPGITKRVKIKTQLCRRWIFPQPGVKVEVCRHRTTG